MAMSSGIFFIPVVFLLLFLGRRWALPKPIPGVPYRQESARNILGDGPAMLEALSKTNLTWMQWVALEMQKTESAIFQIFLPFKRPIVVLADYQEARDICLRRCPREFDRSTLLSELLSGLLPNSHILSRTNASFKAHRRLLQPLMSARFLNCVAAPVLHAQALELTRLWEVKLGISSGKPFRADGDIFDAALDAAFGFTFGHEFPHSAIRPKLQVLKRMLAHATALSTDTMTDCDSNESYFQFPEAQVDDEVAATLTLIESVEQVQGSLSMRLTWKLLSMTGRIRWARKVRDAYVQNALDQAVQRMSVAAQQQKDDAAVDYIVRQEQEAAHKEGRHAHFYSSDIKGEIFGFTVGGHETTSTTLAWGLKFLADDQRVQDSLRSALLHKYPEARTGRREPSVPEILAAQLPYLDAVIEEILRCGGTTPALDREAMVDTDVLGCRIPKGTTILMLTQSSSMKTPALHVGNHQRSSTSRAHGQRVWDDEDITLFRPERWLAAQGPETTFQSTAGPFLAFGVGIRSCWGRKLGYLELKLYLTLLVWNFRFLSCPPDLSSYTAVSGVTSKPKCCYVRLEKTGLSREAFP